MKLFTALIVLFTSATASAEEGWNSAFWLGMSYSASTSGTVKIGTVSSNPTSVDGKSAFNLGAEYYRRTASPVNVAIALEDIWLGSQDGPADFMFSLLVGPRFDTKTPINLWAEVLAGPALTTLGETSASSGGLTVVANSSSYLSIAVSPRIGIDFPISNKVSVGIQAAYVTTSGSIDGKYYGSTSGSFTEDFSRHNLTTALRFSWKIGNSEKTEQEVRPIPSEASNLAEPSPAAESPHKLDADELIKIKKLKDAGVLTEEEYQERKAKLLK